MGPRLVKSFETLWRRYFDGADLPLVFWYTEDEAGPPLAKAGRIHRCLMANLAKVRAGRPLRFDADAIGCAGGKRYCGFSHALRPNFRYFLSCGISGKMEGERYKRSPELVDEMLASAPTFDAPGRYIVFKRWDQIADDDPRPEAVVFFGTPDVLAGLFTLANFDQAGETGVIAPFGAGCASVVQHPVLEGRSTTPRCVLGGFDPSARLYTPGDVLSFAVPFSRFMAMAGNMQESFLTTPTWERIRRRIARTGTAARARART